MTARVQVGVAFITEGRFTIPIRQEQEKFCSLPFPKTQAQARTDRHFALALAIKAVTLSSFTMKFPAVAFSLCLLTPPLQADTENLFPEQIAEWKMAGPGQFAIADQVATAEGGMGLWWFSKEKYQSATLSLEFKLDDPNQNSGIFVRFPDPGGDPWVAVRQGYEIQISGREVGKTFTGAIYDIQAPASNPLRADGEWNTMKIHTVTAWEDTIAVEINGHLVNVFNPSPGRGEGQGYFGIQNHDPQSPVQFRKIEITKRTPDTRIVDLLTPAQLTAYQTQRNPQAEQGKNWFDLVNFGPAHNQTWGDFLDGTYRPNSALKGIVIRPDPANPNLVALFNTETLQFVTATSAGVSLDNTPWAEAHGTQNKVNNAEKSLFTQELQAAWPDQNGSYKDLRANKGFGNYPHLSFKGYYRHGHDIVLDYTVNGLPVLEMLSANAVGQLSTRIESSDLDLSLRSGPEEMATTRVAETLTALTKGGPAIFPETFAVEGQVDEGKGPYLVDQIPLPPVLGESPWRLKVRTSDFDFFPDGDRAAICTWDGDVWLLSGLNEFRTLTWKRFASGLFEPLGLKIVDDVIHVNCRDAIWQLIDLNGDDEADHYRIFNNDIIITDNFHEFSFGLETDASGNFYFAKAAPVRSGGRNFERILPHNGAFLKVTPDGQNLSVVATGLRAPGGIGVGPEGELTTGENEGTWQPACKINYFTPDEQPVFLGVEQTRQGVKSEFKEPLCYLPMKVDNSGGQQVWVPANSKIGLQAGEMLHLSYGQSSIYRVLTQKTPSGQLQGGVVKLPIRLSSSAQRAAFHPDGSMYVLGLRGWQTNAAKEAGLQRVRYREQAPLHLPEDMTVTGDQLIIRFESPLDEELAADLESYAIKRWNYVRGPQYGSGHFAISTPNKEAEANALTQESKGHREEDRMTITAAALDEDGRTIRLTIPELAPAHQMEISYDLESTDGEVIIGTLYSTIHQN